VPGAFSSPPHATMTASATSRRLMRGV
jgi:hypothetical protein